LTLTLAAYIQWWTVIQLTSALEGKAPSNQEVVGSAPHLLESVIMQPSCLRIVAARLSVYASPQLEKVKLYKAENLWRQM